MEQVDLALDEVVHLQEEGPTDQDVSTVLEIEQRAHENGLQVKFFLSCMLKFFVLVSFMDFNLCHFFHLSEF